MKVIPIKQHVDAGMCGCGCGGALKSGKSFLDRHQYTGRYERFGYVFVRTPTGYVPEHVLIAESVIGKKLPAKAMVHHSNGDRLDNRRENLVICENREYHALIHQRIRVVARGGSPSRDKWCCGCQSLRPITEFGKSINRMDGLNVACKSCINSKYGKNRIKYSGRDSSMASISEQRKGLAE